MRLHSILSGGRPNARRFAILLMTIAVASAAAQTTPASTPDSTLHNVSVRDNQGVYSVTARFSVPQPPATVMAVLTDFERIPEFMPGVTTSVVRERSVGRVLIEQEAVARVMMFSKRVHLILEVEQEAGALRFRDTGGRSFAVYEGAWLVSADDGQTLIEYQLRAKPKFEVPGFLLKRLLTRDARTMLERLRREIAGRATSTPTQHELPID